MEKERLNILCLPGTEPDGKFGRKHWISDQAAVGGTVILQCVHHCCTAIRRWGLYIESLDLYHPGRERGRESRLLKTAADIYET